MTKTLLNVQNLVKRYGDFVAVDHVTFEVQHGEIFGLLGPNGAGKTTIIRSIMDIIKPDEGDIHLLGAAPGSVREEIGYLPEERGLYRDLKLVETLVYLAELKGTSRAEAAPRAHEWLARVGLEDRADAKVKDLSRGMQQKLQFAASLIHDPDLLILDEPFQGLDPVNVGLLKKLIRELQAEGKTIVLSAHQMNLVEAMCDRILLIDQGRAMLYGNLAEIKRNYAANAVRLRTSDEVGELPGVTRIEQAGDVMVLTLNGNSPQELLKTLVERGIEVESFEVATIPLEEIFIKVVKDGSDA